MSLPIPSIKGISWKRRGQGGVTVEKNRANDSDSKRHRNETGVGVRGGRGSDDRGVKTDPEERERRGRKVSDSGS